MAQPGGAAAINGFLYQIVHHIDWLARATLDTTGDKDEIRNARLVLEPPCGGDAVAEAKDRYLVEQYKTRRTDRLWSLGDLIPVLSDLRKAVPQGLPRHAEYRFVTDGRGGQLDAFKAFLGDVQSSTGPQQLDSLGRRRYGQLWKNLTNREFFEDMERRTRPTWSKVQPQDTLFHHLLARFRMKFQQTLAARAAVIDDMMRPFVQKRGTEGDIRRQLVAVVMERISNGSNVFEPHEIRAMFKKVGLNPDRVCRYNALHTTISALTKRRAAALRYAPDRDVRAAPEWPADKPVLLISGDSGTGKTWQLGRLLTAAAEDSRIATLVPAANTHEQLLSAAASDLAQRGLGDASNPGLVEVSEILRRMNPDGSTPRVTIALDDVRDADLVRDLVRQDWSDWDMALALTVPGHVARALVQSDAATIHVHPVDDFSTDELDEFLQRSGRQWSDLPSDLRRLLRKPVMAGIFVDIPHSSFSTTPHTEYEIFETYWERISVKGKLGDEGIVLALAGHVIDGKPYPLERRAWPGLGLTRDAMEGLSASGWIACSDAGEVEFVHDRLLNWAVAKSLAHGFSGGKWDIEGLWARLEAAERHSPNRFGYVPMDLLWLLAESAANAGPLACFVEHLEDRHGFGTELLYQFLLPTLGDRAVPILAERLAQLASASGDYRVALVARSFASLARQSPVDLQQLQKAVDELLASTSPVHQNAALAFLEVLPRPATLPRLWQIHQARHEALHAPHDNSNSTADYHASFSALRAGITHDPAWLRCRIVRNAEERSPASELAYLLNALDHKEADDIWRDTADGLFAGVPADKPRSLLLCVATFRDHSRIDFVLANLSNPEDSANTAALTTLAILDPREAIERLADVRDFDRYVSRNRWLPFLLRSHPTALRQRIRGLGDTHAQTLWLIAELFTERANQIDPATLRFLLDALRRTLRDHSPSVLEDVPAWLDKALDLLARIARNELLAVLREEADGELERMIAAVACSRLRSNSNVLDPVVENARRVLIMISGDGTTTLISRELESPHFWIRHRGLKWAWITDAAAVVELLVAIAMRPIPPDVRRDPLAHHLTDDHLQPWYEFIDATLALAAVAADADLVGLLEETLCVDVSDDLSRLRAHAGPMPKRLTNHAWRTLRTADGAKDETLAGLLVARLSGDTALIPPTRSTLRRVQPNSRIAMHACIALQMLGDSSKEFVKLARKLLDTKENRSHGLSALLGLGAEGCAMVGAWFENADRTSSLDPGVLGGAIRALYANAATRSLAIDLASRACREGKLPVDPPYDIAVESRDPELRERIVEVAFATETDTPTATLRAIEGLARVDLPKAIAAIKNALPHAPKAATRMCRLLICIAPETAPRDLLALAAAAKAKALREAVGRALRQADRPVVTTLLTTALRGSKPERQTAAEIAAWLPVPDIATALENCLNHDSDMQVRHAALDALEAHDREAAVLGLLRAFRTSAGRHRWGLLIAVLDAGDPHLLLDQNDELWLGRVLSDVPAAFSLVADRRLKQRMNKDN